MESLSQPLQLILPPTDWLQSQRHTIIQFKREKTSHFMWSHSHSAFHIILKFKYFVTTLNFLLYFKKLVIYSTWSLKTFGKKFNQNCMWILSKLSFLLSLSVFFPLVNSGDLPHDPQTLTSKTWLLLFIFHHLFLDILLDFRPFV